MDQIRGLLGVDIQQVLADIDMSNTAGLGLDEWQAYLLGWAREKHSRLLCQSKARIYIGRRIHKQQPLGLSGQPRHDKKRMARGVPFAIKLELFQELGNFHGLLEFVPIP